MSRLAASRRDALRLLLAGTCACCLPAAGRADEGMITFCSTPGVDGQDFEKIDLDTFEDRALRSYFRQERDNLFAFFGLDDATMFVAPQMDGALMQISDDRRRGEVIVGLKFVERVGNTSHGMIKLSSVIAHETAHVYQVTWKLDNSLRDQKGYPIKFVELHADYLAGANLGGRHFKTEAASDIAGLFYDLGDQAWRAPDHHGLEGERFLAFAQGFNDGKKLISDQGSDYRPTSDDVQTLALMGMKYVAEAD